MKKKKSRLQNLLVNLKINYSKKNKLFYIAVKKKTNLIYFNIYFIFFLLIFFLIYKTILNNT
jgi:hypothetical protein